MKKWLHQSLAFIVSLVITGLVFSDTTKAQTATFNDPAGNGTTNKWTAPTGVTSITVEVWGAGGAGGGFTGTQNNRGGGGGGGGAYRKTMSVAVTPGVTYDITVGAGGPGSFGNGGAGGASSATFDGAVTVTVAGGNGGTGASASNGTGGTGGTGGTFSGGNGSNGANGFGGGGGSSAGTASNGNSVVASGTGGVAVTGGGAGGNGSFGSGGGNGDPGGAPGGGGGGGRNMGEDLNRNGGAGGNGQVIITWTCPTATISYTGSPYCSNGGAATVTQTGAAGGTYSSTVGLSINASTGDVDLGASTPGTYTITYTIAAAGGCPQVQATAPITITQLPSAIISYNGSPYCLNGGTATVTQTGTTGGTYSSTAGLSINASTGDVDLGASTTVLIPLHTRLRLPVVVPRYRRPHPLL